MAKRRGSSRGTGYKNPPRHTRFRPGQSGNPKGRPKGSRNLVKDVEKELAAQVFINEHGTRKKIPIRRLIAKQLINLAAKGDLKGIAMVLSTLGAAEHDPADSAPQDVPNRPEDELVMASIVRRIRSMEEAPDATEGTQEPPKPPQTPSTEDEEKLP